MTILELPPNPPGCLPLTDPESARLRAQYPGLWANWQKTCLTCGKNGEFKTRHGDEIVTMRCDCMAQWALHRWLLAAGIGTNYQRLSWYDVKRVPGQVTNAVLTYIDQADANIRSGRGMTLWAKQMGTGKTMLVTLLLKALLARGVDGYFTQFNEMLDNFSAGWRSEEERAWFTRRVRNAGVLVVDDIGREYKGRIEVAESMFDMVIRARVANAQPTLITTNLSPDELRQGYGGNVMSLLSEVNTEIEVAGTDYRPQVAVQAAEDATAGVVKPLVVG